MNVVFSRNRVKMHIEVSVALNFVISYLYNKLPRRRVNIFGEELEKCLTEKFAGHWYPEKPYRGSAYRCIKTGSPIDPVFEKASRESGVAIQDVLENLPQDLAVWVDPGEVSYRIGEKGAVKILYNENSGGLQFDIHDDRTADREVRVIIIYNIILLSTTILSSILYCLRPCLRGSFVLAICRGLVTWDHQYLFKL